MEIYWMSPDDFLMLYSLTELHHKQLYNVFMGDPSLSDAQSQDSWACRNYIQVLKQH